MRVILDTDMAMGAPGSEIDDGFALALLVADDSFELELVTSVNGNIDVESGTYLSIEMLRRLGRPEVPVVRGAAAPLVEPDRARVAPEQVRADFGHHVASPGFAAAEIARRVLAEPGEITVVAIGPLTNVAAAIALDPAVASAAREIVVMGGVYRAHTNRQAMPGEFNFWVDPHAASAVLRSGAAIRLVGLDVTTQVRLTRSHAAAMVDSGRPFGGFAGECTLAWLERLADENPGEAGADESCAMHDPLAVAALSRPELLTWAQAHVDVVADSEVARGVCVTDFLTGRDAPRANATVATGVDVDAFMSYFLDRITSR